MTPEGRPEEHPRPAVSIVIPTLDGGERLEECLAAIESQRFDLPFEVVCIDSESRPTELERMRGHRVRIIGIRRSDFDHGATRDLGARESRGEILVFLNQDAVPADEDWLARLIEPLRAAEDLAAVQGGMLERPEGERFYWTVSGNWFYFTREMRRWHERFEGFGFNTVNAAVRRGAWERCPFGPAPILEDKKWQRAAVAAGLRVIKRSDAAVVHSHDYTLREVVRRVRNEGYGWRFVGESYGLRDALGDLFLSRVLRHWVRGIVRGRIQTLAELLYPWIRPVALYVGNRWSRGVRF